MVRYFIVLKKPQHSTVPKNSQPSISLMKAPKPMSPPESSLNHSTQKWVHQNSVQHFWSSLNSTVKLIPVSHFLSHFLAQVFLHLD